LATSLLTNFDVATASGIGGGDVPTADGIAPTASPVAVLFLLLSGAAELSDAPFVVLRFLPAAALPPAGLQRAARSEGKGAARDACGSGEGGFEPATAAAAAAAAAATASCSDGHGRTGGDETACEG